MIVGKVNQFIEPVIEIVLFFKSKRIKKKAIIDTGFNGYLSIPDSLAKNWYFFGYEKYEIATGDIVEQKVYIGEMIWDKKIKPVYAVSSHSEDFLIGTKLLLQNKLTIDFPNKKVLID